MKKAMNVLTSILIIIVAITAGLYLFMLHHDERYVAHEVDTYVKDEKIGTATYKNDKITVTVNNESSLDPQALGKEAKGITKQYQEARKTGRSKDQGLEFVNQKGHVVAVHYGRKILVTGDLGIRDEASTKKALNNQGITDSNKMLDSAAKKAGFTIIDEPDVKNLFSVKPLLNLFDQELAKTDSALNNITNEIQ